MLDPDCIPALAQTGNTSGWNLIAITCIMIAIGSTTLYFHKKKAKAMLVAMALFITLGTTAATPNIANAAEAKDGVCPSAPLTPNSVSSPATEPTPAPQTSTTQPADTSTTPTPPTNPVVPPPATGSLSGRVFYERDWSTSIKGNGILDKTASIGEDYLENVTADMYPVPSLQAQVIDATTNSPVGTAIDVQNGSFKADGLLPGTYKIDFDYKDILGNTGDSISSQWKYWTLTSTPSAPNDIQVFPEQTIAARAHLTNGKILDKVWTQTTGSSSAILNFYFISGKTAPVASIEFYDTQTGRTIVTKPGSDMNVDPNGTGSFPSFLDAQMGWTTLPTNPSPTEVVNHVDANGITTDTFTVIANQETTGADAGIKILKMAAPK
ncbi:hypothetical protein [Arcanobacterium bovis]|uniref:Uncharacterized protein n=1 Tax=Arcanobacterium bovis TaxID=2529275 RepID=A0A4Q9UYR9_9ACTO|nr:hypothetical protein [Arcanobacterium bovis]TBW20839.1 hypothetical protein EZJ44_07890 [Arcanobacterium bovis]